MTADSATTWRAFALDDLERRQAESGRAYLEFLRVPTLSSGLYVLPAGSLDDQSPHAQDELYYVLEGAAKFRVGDEVVDAVRGSVLFVKAGIEHRFADIEEDLKVLVFFSTAR